MSLYHQIYQGESFSEQDFIEAVRYVLGEDFYDAPVEVLESEIISRTELLSESEAENFWRSIGNVAKTVGSGILRGAAAVAPIAGTVLGAKFGVPQLGAAAGNMVSNLANAGSNALRQSVRPIPRPVYRRPVRAARRGNPELQNAWRDTTRFVAGAGRAVLPALNQYAQDNPIALNQHSQNDISRMQKLYQQLGNILNSPELQVGQAQQSIGASSPNAPIENHSYTDLIESINYLTENILYEYYNEGFIPQEDYFAEENGQFVRLYQPGTLERLENLVGTF
jgi:hypothetical protein